MGPALFGIDLGGTKTEGVVLLPDGQEVLRHRVATIRGSYAGTVQTISGLVRHLEQQSGMDCRHLGVGIPGSVSPVTGLVRNGNSTWINGQHLQADLEAALGRDVRLSNDANCLALSEARDGAAAAAASAFAVILGTGVGGGLVINGQIVTGAHGLAGEWGHIPLSDESHAGPDCFCGRRGCVETFLSGPGLVRDYISAGGASADKVQAIVARAEAGEAAAIAALARHRRRLGRALAVIVNTLDPEVIVLGGGVSNLPGLVKSLPAAIAPHVFAAPEDRVEIDVRLAKFGDSSGVRGAARLWERQA